MCCQERLLAFSDGVIAVYLTIMVLDMKLPETAGTDWSALKCVHCVWGVVAWFGQTD